MTIKLLESYIAEKKLTRVLPLNTLSGATVGIDAEYLYHQLYSGAPPKTDPLLHALGGIPFSLKFRVEALLAGLKKAGITPLFVFKGIEIPRRENPFVRAEAGQVKRASAWDSYDKAKGENAVSIFGEIETIQFSEVSRYMMKILADHEVEYIAAPYSPWAQLVYLLTHEKQYVDAIYTSNEAFMFDLDRVIVSIDITNDNFQYVQKRAIIADIGIINAEQFFDLCVLAGPDFSSPFPLIEQPQLSIHAQIRALRDLLRNFISGYGTVMSYAEHPLIKEVDYIETYRRTWCAIKFQPVFNSEGRTRPLSKNEPNDMHEFIGQRLPDEINFYLCRGIIGPEILGALTSGKFVELVPLAGGESPEYREFLRKIESMKAQSLSLLTQPLNRFYQAKQVNVIYWFDQTNETAIPHRITPTTYETVKTWNVPQSIIKEKLAESAQPDLKFAILSLVDDAFAEKTIAVKRARDPLTPDKLPQLLQTSTEVLANTYWRFLQLRSFVTDKHVLTTWGVALTAAITSSKAEDNFTEPLVTAIELVRTNVLTNKSYPSSYSGVPIHGTDEQKAHILLISRVASLLPLEQQPAGYSGPLSRSLLLFNSFATKYTSNARALLEMILFSLLANNDANKYGEVRWESLGVSLPFKSSTNSGLGVAVKTYLDELCTKESPSDAEEREKMATFLKKQFAVATDIVAEYERALRLWDAVVVAVKTAAVDDTVSAAELKPFTDADAWLAKMR